MKKSLYCKFKETSLAVDASVACDQMRDQNFLFGNPWIAGWFV